MFSKFVNDWPSFKNQNMATNWMKLCFFSIVSLKTTIISTMLLLSLLAHNHSFLACWLLVDMKYWPTINLKHVILHFFLLACFYKLLNLGTNKFSLPSTSLQTLHWTMLNFPSHPTITLAQGHFVINTFWKIQFNSHSFWCVSFMQVWDLKIEN
jgi:hypothetical protein